MTGVMKSYKLGMSRGLMIAVRHISLLTVYANLDTYDIISLVVMVF